MMKPNKILSIDAETDGLWGQVFAIGAVVYEYKEVCPMIVKDANGRINPAHGRLYGTPDPEKWPTDPGPYHGWVQDGPLEWKWHRVAGFDMRCPAEIQNQWVKDNVLPTLTGMTTASTYEEMIERFARFYLEHKGAKIVTHMGYIVEAYLLREMQRLGFLGEWDGPYSDYFAAWHDVSQDLEQAGEKPSSVDDYAKKHNILIQPFGRGDNLRLAAEGKTHNPCDDAEIAARVWIHLNQNTQL